VLFELRPARYVLYALLTWPGLLLAEYDSSATCSRSEWNEYFDHINHHVTSFWRLPFRHSPISCTILLRLDFRGEVQNVEILACDDDESVWKSAENAGYLSSPLPKPRNLACFLDQMTVRLRYTPTS